MTDPLKPFDYSGIRNIEIKFKKEISETQINLSGKIRVDMATAIVKKEFNSYDQINVWKKEISEKTGLVFNLITTEI